MDAPAPPNAPFVRWFADLGMRDLAIVGGKNASLGELYRALKQAGVRVPNGFALTTAAYRAALAKGSAEQDLHALLDDLDVTNVRALARAAAQAREIVYEAGALPALREAVEEAYAQLEAEYGARVAVAVRSSATAEDLPTASFAGQHESYLNVVGAAAVVEACRRCLASIFTDRAIVYRVNNGFDHFRVALSAGVMKMVRSDEASSGVMFSLDTESGHRGVVFITGSWGLGENIVQGEVDPDEFYVHKPTYTAGHRCVLSRRLGEKATRMIYDRRGGMTGIRRVETPAAARGRYCLADAEVLELAGHAIAIETHYSRLAGHDTPMDIEWAKDGEDGALYIIQARPETVASRREPGAVETHALTGTGPVLVTGHAVGERIATGKVRVVRSTADLARFAEGEVLVAEATRPDWQPVMKKASAIVTDHGGRTCHAAIVARELGVPAVVGAGDATRKLRAGHPVTVSCAGGEMGAVYEGAVPFTVTKLRASDIPRPKTHVMVNLGNPDLAFRTAMLPSDGVGLARMEFIISEAIGIHPMALVDPARVASAADRREIARRVKEYAAPQDYFVERLSEGVGTIAAAFWPRPVIVRLSDFKSNEYAALIGGAAFEPKEENPMIGFRGASRYSHPAYAPGFALECRALTRVREDMGLTNLKIMVPFCRREAEAKAVLATMAEHGLRRGENGLDVYIMCEIPNNVIRIDAFAQLFDGFSIGSNDLTQLTLGVDRDSEIVAFDFDEMDPGMLEILKLAVTGARRNDRHVGICGEAPANHPELARMLVAWGISSLSVNPASLVPTLKVAKAAEDQAP
ncbi:MAG: phosphoenolpyruvate synthase [Hyphomicrobiales bacterium]